jgi:hypothetical protein
MATAKVTEVRQREFDARQRVLGLRRAVFDARKIEDTPQLVEAEREMQHISDERAAAERSDGVDDGRIVSVTPAANLMGPNTTGLDVKVDLRMSSVVTSLVHLFDSGEQPLVTYEILNMNNETKRLRLISYVEAFSARAVDTIEIKHLEKVTLAQVPTFFPDRVKPLTELTRASVNVEVQDLDAKTEVHKTIPVWLLARTTAPLQVKDPSTGKWKDMTRYLGAFVTPNAPEVMTYVRTAVDKHPNKRLVGYQVDKEEVATEVRAVFESLTASGISYVNSIIDFTPETGSSNQRVRLPRESLSDRSANCIDGTVLMASLLEAISLNPAIVIIPGHAFLAWETWKNASEWRYLETTMMATHSFDEACTQGDLTARKWLASNAGDQTMFKRWSLRDLRAAGITPLE